MRTILRYWCISSDKNIFLRIFFSATASFLPYLLQLQMCLVQRLHLWTGIICEWGQFYGTIPVYFVFLKHFLYSCLHYIYDLKWDTGVSLYYLKAHIRYYCLNIALNIKFV